MSLDVKSIFDNVSHTRLMYNLRKRKIPERLVNWVGDFLTRRRTEIRIADFTLEESRIDAGIPQGSPLSPILYLFYNADLLDNCTSIRDRTSSIGFVDDVNILIYNTSIRGNCEALERAYIAYETWSKHHGSAFSVKKYKLIYFTRVPKRFDINVGVKINNNQINLKPDIRMLGIRLDLKLNWKAQLNAVETRVVHLRSALTSLTALTWGALMAAGLKFYTAIIRSTLIYDNNV